MDDFAGEICVERAGMSPLYFCDLAEHLIYQFISGNVYTE